MTETATVAATATARLLLHRRGCCSGDSSASPRSRGDRMEAASQLSASALSASAKIVSKIPSLLHTLARPYRNLFVFEHFLPSTFRQVLDFVSGFRQVLIVVSCVIALFVARTKKPCLFVLFREVSFLISSFHLVS
jgi:hypothetical protein